ncbi:uncharacterized protein G2W53_015873 [Senna tora]|uniref:Uncharacterized protein n=1 Tax=Senna tora TaxID=362788 RepID=A0A834WVK7_9FABA|nr:uncharacterized protein G2W53_015873 [Senna tora]
MVIIGRSELKLSGSWSSPNKDRRSTALK